MLFLNLKFKYHLCAEKFWKATAKILLKLEERAWGQFERHIKELEKIDDKIKTGKYKRPN